MSSRGTDVFISHAGRDTAWAEWLAWQLQLAGYTVELNVWDLGSGEDFVTRMAVALERAGSTARGVHRGLLHPAFGGADLRAAFAGNGAAEGRIVPVLVEPVTLPRLYATLIPLDLNRSQLNHRAGRHPSASARLEPLRQALPAGELPATLV